MSGKSFTWVLLMAWNHISRKLDDEEGTENLHWHCTTLNKTKRFCDRNMNKYQENMTLCRRDALFADIRHLDWVLCVCVVMYVLLIVSVDHVTVEGF